MARSSVVQAFLATWWIGLRLAHAGFCPQGFGAGANFPEAWKIPEWPQLSQEEAFLLRTVALEGFTKEDINEEYLEGPGEAFKMQGRETYWQASGNYFMFYCQRFQKWRVAQISAFGQNMDGQCFGFVSDAQPGRDIRNETHLRGWIEVIDGKWELMKEAGVSHLGTLGEQMEEEEEYEEEEGECDSPDGEGDGNPFGEKKEKKKKSNCPVMPVVRKAKKKVKTAVKAMSKWVKRLFPKLLGAPEEAAEGEEEEEEDEEEDEETFSEDGVTPAPREKKTRKKKKRTKWEDNWDSSASKASEPASEASETKAAEL